MTYKESYEKCTSLEELLNEVKNDLATAYIVNPDRFQIIKEAAEDVANKKFNKTIKNFLKEETKC